MRLPLGLEWPRLVFAALGFVPIVTLAAALFGWVPLHVSARWLVLPAVPVAIALGLARPVWGRRALLGFLAGIVATGAYDATRLALVWAGVWPDFIPAIGQMAALDQAAHPAIGYLWRFVGNGGGMGLTFAMLTTGAVRLGRPGTRIGTAYGAFICCCLYATLLFAPTAQSQLFPLNPVTAVFAMIGHVDFGAVLGYLLRRWLAEPDALSSVVPHAGAECVPSAEIRS